MRTDDGPRIVVGIGAAILILWVVLNAIESFQYGMTIGRVIVPTLAYLSLPVIVFWWAFWGGD